jgi:hypothetical protein
MSTSKCSNTCTTPCGTISDREAVQKCRHRGDRLSCVFRLKLRRLDSLCEVYGEHDSHLLVLWYVVPLSRQEAAENRRISVKSVILPLTFYLWERTNVHIYDGFLNSEHIQVFVLGACFLSLRLLLCFGGTH